mmetsp:Transcript_16279/g.44160  ORF Transcript_16279/g.44160 Transcript_16279/m.44160 type:complete len:773 (+) Transcript_16279:49-2367(+)
MQTLRRRLKITRRDGFLLSSETPPIQARFGASYVTLQAECFEAAVRLSMLREDVKLEHIDGLCAALFGTPQYRCICDWLLELSCSLLDPSITKSALKHEDSKIIFKCSLSEWFRLPLSMSVVKGWFRPQREVYSVFQSSMSQEERFAYFKARVCPLQALRAEDGWLFNEMQAQAQRFMDDISICCIHRFQKLVSEPEGNILIEQPTVSDLAFLERGVSFTTPERVQEFCSKNVNSNISLTLDVQSPVSPMLARQQYSPDKATRLMSNYDVTEGDFVVLNLDGEKSSPRNNEYVETCSSQPSSGNFVMYTAPTRQDHPLVGAVLVDMSEVRTVLDNLYPSEVTDCTSGIKNWPRRQRSFQEQKTPWFMQSSAGTEKKKRHRRASECLGRRNHDEFSELCASQFIARVPSSELGCPSNLGLNSPRALNIQNEANVPSAGCRLADDVCSTADFLKLMNESTRSVPAKLDQRRELGETVITAAVEPVNVPESALNKQFLDGTNGNQCCHLFSPSLAPVATSCCLGPDMQPAELSLNEADVHQQDNQPAPSESCEIDSFSIMDKRLLDGSVEEELYLNQLYQKSQDLDQDFQTEVLSVVASHQVQECIDGQQRDLKTTNSQASSTIARLGSAAITIHNFVCLFSDGSVGPVEVHCAPPKSITRMREKLQEYALPHPRARFPLCANILDPVRASIVCSGPKHMLEVFSWLTKSSQQNLGSGIGRLQVCRVKNKFAWPAEALPDGYRDLQLFSLLESGDGQRIIGEIQVISESRTLLVI